MVKTGVGEGEEEDGGKDGGKKGGVSERERGERRGGDGG
jgi:hypothetical protein